MAWLYFLIELLLEVKAQMRRMSAEGTVVEVGARPELLLAVQGS